MAFTQTDNQQSHLHHESPSHLRPGRRQGIIEVSLGSLQEMVGRADLPVEALLQVINEGERREGPQVGGCGELGTNSATGHHQPKKKKKKVSTNTTYPYVVLSSYLCGFLPTNHFSVLAKQAFPMFGGG
jgi:hypothetical protein